MTTHGMTHTSLYNKWRGILGRCNIQSNSKYKSYGGRGIKNLWTSFEDFRDDMQASYLRHVATHGEKQTTIERVDVNGPYCKGNCRWATLKEQARNKTTSRFIMFRGQRRCLSEWAEIYGMTTIQLWGRLEQGVPFDEAINVSV